MGTEEGLSRQLPSGTVSNDDHRGRPRRQLRGESLRRSLRSALGGGDRRPVAHPLRCRRSAAARCGTSSAADGLVEAALVRRSPKTPPGASSSPMARASPIAMASASRRWATTPGSTPRASDRSAQTANGTLWAGGYARLARLVSEPGSGPPRFLSYGAASGLADLLVLTIADDRQGRLLLGTNHGVLSLRSRRRATGSVRCMRASTAPRARSRARSRTAAPSRATSRDAPGSASRADVTGFPGRSRFTPGAGGLRRSSSSAWRRAVASSSALHSPACELADEPQLGRRADRAAARGLQPPRRGARADLQWRRAGAVPVPARRLRERLVRATARGVPRLHQPGPGPVSSAGARRARQRHLERAGRARSRGLARLVPAATGHAARRPGADRRRSSRRPPSARGVSGRAIARWRGTSPNAPTTSRATRARSRSTPMRSTAPTSGSGSPTAIAASSWPR